MTIKGCAAFSKSLWVLCHVWCTEFCGKCPPSSRVFPCMIVHLCINWVALNSDFWLSMPAFLSLFFQRQIPISSCFLSILRREENLYIRQLMLNLKGAQGKIYLLQTIHLCSLCGRCTDKAAELSCRPAAGLPGISHTPQCLCSGRPHCRLFLALLNTSQDVNPFHLRIWILSTQGI